MKFSKLLYVAILALLIFSCKKKDAIEIAKKNLSERIKYQDYISDVTTGVLSVEDPVFVVLHNPVQGWSDNQELSEKVLSVSPKVAGKVIAINNRTISFQPDQKFEEDTDYTFTLNLENLVTNLKEGLDNEFVFTIKTLKQYFAVSTHNTQSYNSDLLYINGEIVSSDHLQKKTAKQLISVTQKGKKIPITFTESAEKGRQFNFRIDSIKRFEEDSKIEIEWSGKDFGIESTGKLVKIIPGKNNFSVIGITVLSNEENTYLEINFSDPLLKNQNFDGLVTLDEYDGHKYLVEGNVLKVYPNWTRIKKVSELKVTVLEGIKSTNRIKLKNRYTETISFEQTKPEVKLLQNGTILPTSDNLKFNFEAINLRAVDVEVIKIYQNNIMQFLQFNNLNGTGNLKSVARPIAKKRILLSENISFSNLDKWNAFAIDLKSLITPDPGAIYRVELKFKKEYSLYRCNGKIINTSLNSKISESDNYDTETESSLWDNAEYYNDYYYNYNWRERDNPCSDSYYVNRTVGANILASNIGVIAKKGINNSYVIIVTNILTTKPIPNAKVSFYDFQQQKLGIATTDKDGITGFDANRPAFFAIVKSGKQQMYVKLNDGNALSVSKFDVSGKETKKGIKGFIYGERGVWRPGDTLYLSFMLNDKLKKLPKNHPIKFELSDPYGKITYKETKTKGVHNLYKFAIKTSDEDPTGNWQAKIKVGGVSFTKALKIETIKPNRLKIKATFDKKLLSLQHQIRGNIHVTWLHGAVARNLKTEMNVRFRPKKTIFKNFQGYIFDDPTRTFATEEQQIFTGRISSEGRVNFNFNPRLKRKAAGMLKASFITKVQENGGDFSADVISKDFSPYKTYVGLNTPKGDKTRGMLLTDTKHNFEIVTVDENGKPKQTNALKVYVYKISWKWWWDTTEDNLSSYNKGSFHDQVLDTVVSTNSNGKANFNFELKYPEWGRYLVRVIDPKGGHATGKTIYIDWPGWAGKSKKNDPSAATMLVFSTDKTKYKIGEKAIVTFPSSEGGRALISVENGTEPLSSFWVNTQKNETKFELPIDKLYTPNVFIHITLLQPHATLSNDLPIRLYGLTPILVEDPNTHLKPKLVMPDVLKPEKTITLQVSESNGRPMTYSLAIVDEGLLDLTRFKTPNPWNSFYAKEALGVKTWDVYDDVIGAYGGSINQVFSIGGDAESGGSTSKKANRFKPMVIYKGPFELKKGERLTHKIKVPKYIGSVRTMIVASNANLSAYGNVEKTTPVRKPLMVLSSLPRKITPGEKITVPVTVFAMENKVKNVTVTLKPQPGFTIIGEATKSISFPQPDEKMVYFEIEVTEGSTTTNIEVLANGNGEKASYNVPIDILNPNPITTEISSIILDPNSKKDIDFSSFGIDGSESSSLEFSSLPPMNFEGRLHYLIQYPHGCVEQLTSAAFPQLYLHDIFKLSSVKKQRIQKNIESAILKLKQFIQPSGGMAYWAGHSTPNDWGTSYAGNFLLEANKQGYTLPITFKSNWITYQQQMANRWNSEFNDLAQAYRLYTLVLAGSPDLSSMNRLRESSLLSNEAKLRLAAAYALLNQDKAAKELIQNTTLRFENRNNNHVTFGSINRNKAMALETYILLKDKAKAQELANDLAKELSSKKWMSTQTVSFALMAMTKYIQFVGGNGIQVSYTLNGKSTAINTKNTIASVANLGILKNNKLSIKNNNNSTLFVQLVTKGILPIGKEKSIQSKLNAIVDYKNKEGKIIDINALSQGTEFISEVTITNTSEMNVKNIALTKIIPSGWEVVNTRFTDFGTFKANKVTHTDIRDDRVLFYFDLKPKESKTVTILLNASYLGKYYLPGVQCEAMYDNQFMVRTLGKWIQVVK